MLNIKDPVAHELAKELAERRKTSMTQAVVGALRRDLESVKAEDEAERKARREDLEAFLRDYWASHSGAGPSLEEIEAEIYDEHGLPR